MIYRFGDYELDLTKVELRAVEAPVAIEPQVFKLLRFLVERRDRMVSKDEIIEHVWNGRIISDAALSSRIKSARAAVGDTGAAQAVIRTVRGHGFRFVADVRHESAPAAPPTEQPHAPDPSPSPPTRPSIAVLPFASLGDSQLTQSIADAFSHEVIAALSRMRWLFVIARASSFRFRGPDADVQDAAAALGVRYVLTGSFELWDKTIALTVELNDAQGGFVLWADRVSGKLGDIHELRAALIASIVASLELQIPLNEARAARPGLPATLDAWSAYHLGLGHMYRFTNDDNVRAKQLFTRAAELDPSFARARAGLSFVHFQNAFLDYTGDRTGEGDLARRHAEAAIELDPLDPFANLTMGRSHWLAGDLDGSLGWLERATSLNPNYAQGVYSRAWAETLGGQSASGQRHADEAIALSPLDPLLYGMLGTRALSHMVEREYDLAVPWAERAARAPGAHVLISLIAVAAYQLAGDTERARRLTQNVKRLRPDVTRAHFFQSFPMTCQTARDEIEGALKASGL